MGVDAVRLAVVFCLSAVSAWSAPEAVRAWDFEQDLQGWATLDKQAELDRCAQAAHVYQGQGSLRFSFLQRPVQEVNKENPDLAGTLFAPVEGLPNARALHLAISTSVSGPIIFMCREKDESNYMRFAHVEAGRWHALDLDLAAFALDEHSTDENGRLDPDQIQAIGVVDPAGFLLALAATGKSPFYLAPPVYREIWLDDVRALTEFTRQMRPARPPVGGEAVMIEDCDADTAYWTVIGGRDLKVTATTEPAISGTALRLDYDLPARKVLVALCQVRSGLLTGISQLVFCARAGQQLTLAVSLQEADKSVYTATAQVPSGQWTQVALPLTAFKLGDDSRDENHRLDLDQVNNVQFIDPTAILTGADSANTLWLDDIMGVR